VCRVALVRTRADFAELLQSRPNLVATTPQWVSGRDASKHSQHASTSPFSTSFYEQFEAGSGQWLIQQRGALRWLISAEGSQTQQNSSYRPWVVDWGISPWDHSATRSLPPHVRSHPLRMCVLVVNFISDWCVSVADHEVMKDCCTNPSQKRSLEWITKT